MQSVSKTPESPCISICVLDEENMCLGCYRTADEISQWFEAKPSTKLSILDNAQKRQQHYEKQA